MICYLPFTYVPERNLSALGLELGPLTVYTPDESLVPDHMRTAANEGGIDLRPLRALAPGRLIPAIEAFKQWADLHQGSLADMAGFFKAAQGRFPMMDETNPSQISTRIRKFEDSAADQDEDPLFQAALFLSVAQEYDHQQEVMRQGLGVVHKMEREMIARLAGKIDAGAMPESENASAGPPADLEPGGYMTAARVEAWAQLALQDANPSLVYLTGSPAVIDHLLNLFPEAEKFAQLGFSTDKAGPCPSVGKWRDALKCLAETALPQPDVLAGFELITDDASAGLTLYKLPGITPRVMLKRLCTSESADDTAVDHHDGRNNALIGLVEFQ